MENQIEEIAGMKVFSNPEDLAASMASQPETPVQEQPEATPEQPERPQFDAVLEEEPQVMESAQTEQPVQEQQTGQEEPQPERPQFDAVLEEQPQAPQIQQEDYSDQEIEDAVFVYLSEKLGRDLNSLDDLNQTQAPALDERIEAIARFVNETGREPQDWFTYQSLNSSEMDDMTAIRVSMASEYSNLSPQELNLLVNSKYKLDSDIHTDEEVRLSQVQLKVDAQKARTQIESVRDTYKAPAPRENQQIDDPEPIITADWINQMSQEVDALEGLEFDLGNEKTFTFGLNDQYRNQLKNKNARLDEYFDPYVSEDGRWDYDLLSSHRAVIDNIDSIVSSAYKQGLGDGQKNLVSKAANVQSQTPSYGEQGVNQTSALADKVKDLMRGQGNGLSINPMNFK
ncbi:MAG: hypothetical protein CMJ25_25535 [Phycisphaerae bacterium]|nr:hypothetical protein [Phycisphaerae bacterium]|tara:strand:+ start:2633 stop:3829 length:1197 start_codon:yes stop_codon:yes gene_type:complete